MDGPLPEGLVEAWQTFLGGEAQRSSGYDDYQEVFDHPLLFPLQRKFELRSMMWLARRSNPTTVFEIGADKGGGIYHWSKCLPTVKRVIACEVRGTPYAKLFEQAFPHIEFLWLPVSSYHWQTKLLVQDWLHCRQAKIDCLFIDGDKSYFDLDFKTYHPMMASGAIVFMHDIQDETTGAAFEKCRQLGSDSCRLVDTTESMTLLQATREGKTNLNAHQNWLKHWRGGSAGVGVIWL